MNRRSVVTVWLLVFSAFLIFAGSAAASPVVGTLTSFVPQSCLSSSFAGCTLKTGFGNFGDTVASDDTLYVAFDGGGGGIAAFALNANGSIGAQRSCATATPAAIPGCGTISGFNANTGSKFLSLGHGGDTLYVSQYGGGATPAAINAYAIASDHSVGALRSCISSAALGSCTVDSTLIYTDGDMAVGSHAAYLVNGASSLSMTMILSFPIQASGALGVHSSCAKSSAAAGCFVVSGGGGFQPSGLAAGSDTLYVANYSSSNVVALALAADGTMTAPRLTVGLNAPGLGYLNDAAIHFPRGVAVTPDGKTLLVQGQLFGTLADYQARFETFALDGTGAIGDRISCMSGGTIAVPAPAGCTTQPLFKTAYNVGVSADGATALLPVAGGASPYESLFAVSLGADGALGAVLSCQASVSLSGCGTQSNFNNSSISPAAAGNAVYAAGTDLTALSREAAATCSPASATVIEGSSVKIDFQCTDPNGDPVTVSSIDNQQHGTTSGVLAGGAPQSVVYTPTPGFTGTDTFSVQTYDGFVIGPLTTATVTVTGSNIKSAINSIPKSIKSSKLKGFSGTASAAGGIHSVSIGLLQLGKGTKPTVGATIAAKVKTCKWLANSGRWKTEKAKKGKCPLPTLLAATGTSSWSFKLKKKLPRGKYVLAARATDIFGNVEDSPLAGARSFTVK